LTVTNIAPGEVTGFNPVTTGGNPVSLTAQTGDIPGGCAACPVTTDDGASSGTAGNFNPFSGDGKGSVRGIERNESASPK
jgi:hypothetical protein